MALEILPALYTNARRLAGVVIANEYGLVPADRLSIGSKICKELVGKVLCDMASMREESVATAAPDDEGVSPGAYEDSMFTEFGRNALDDDRFRGEGGRLDGGVTQQGSSSGMGMGGGGGGQADAEPLGDGDQEADILHRLCPTYASDVNSPLRHVRTRIYFTSESHIHSLVNVLRFSHMRPGAPDSASSLLAPEMQALMDDTPEFDYLTHIVFRMYENKQVPVHAPERFRVEISFSPGAAFNPLDVQLEVAPQQLPCGAGSHVLGPHTLDVVPRVILNDHDDGAAETYAQVDAMLAPLATARKVPASAYALQVALKALNPPHSALKNSARDAGNSSRPADDAGAGAGSTLSPGMAHAASLSSLLVEKSG
jgi:inositol hexakisphosphate/diphosphoinositol-pentakisphosphate kinase